MEVLLGHKLSLEEKVPKRLRKVLDTSEYIKKHHIVFFFLARFR